MLSERELQLAKLLVERLALPSHGGTVNRRIRVPFMALPFDLA